MDLLLVISIDGLNARALGPYGNHWIPTPFFNQLAANGVVFDFFFAESDNCSVNLNSMLGGHHALASSSKSASKIEVSNWDLLITDDKVDDEFANRFLAVDSLEFDNAETSDDQLEALFGLASSQIESCVKNSEQKMLKVWVHSGALFSNWNAPLEVQDWFKDDSDPEPVRFEPPPSLVLDEGFDPDERLRILHAYAAEIVQLDDCLSSFFKTLSELELANIRMAVSGVRGFATGEHLEIGSEGATFHPEKLQLPLIVHAADILPTRVQKVFGSHQFCENIEESISRPNSFDADDSDDESSFAISLCEAFARIQTRAWAYIHPLVDGTIDDESPGQLFAKPGDHLEINEVSDVCPQIANGLRKELERQLKAYASGQIPEPANLAPELFELAT